MGGSTANIVKDVGLNVLTGGLYGTAQAVQGVASTGKVEGAIPAAITPMGPGAAPVQAVGKQVINAGSQALTTPAVPALATPAALAPGIDDAQTKARLIAAQQQAVAQRKRTRSTLLTGGDSSGVAASPVQQARTLG